MLFLRPDSPDCGSNHIVKNGRIHNKKPKYKCQSCGRQFVENPTNKVMSSQTKDLIDRVHLSLANTSTGELTIKISTPKRKNRGNTLNIPLRPR